jgi:hypothetical protein
VFFQNFPFEISLSKFNTFHTWTYQCNWSPNCFFFLLLKFLSNQGLVHRFQLNWFNNMCRSNNCNLTEAGVVKTFIIRQTEVTEYTGDWTTFREALLGITSIRTLCSHKHVCCQRYNFRGRFWSAKGMIRELSYKLYTAPTQTAKARRNGAWASYKHYTRGTPPPPRPKYILNTQPAFPKTWCAALNCKILIKTFVTRQFLIGRSGQVAITCYFVLKRSRIHISTRRPVVWKQAFYDFPRLLRENHGTVLNYTKATSFRILSNLLFINPPIILSNRAQLPKSSLNKPELNTGTFFFLIIY